MSKKEVEIQQSIQLLSEKIVKAVMTRIIDESVCALNAIKSSQEATGSNFTLELESYVNHEMTSEFGRLVAFMHTDDSVKDVQSVAIVEKALQLGILAVPLTDLCLGASALVTLEKMGCTTVGDLLQIDPADVVDAQGVGRTSQYRIKTYLKQRGIDWLGTVSPEHIKAKRYARLADVTVAEMSQGGLTMQFPWLTTWTQKEIKEWVLGKLTDATDAELYPHELFKFGRLFNVSVVRELKYVGIITYGDLLSLTQIELAAKIKLQSKIDKVLPNVTAGLASIGRKLR